MRWFRDHYIAERVLDLGGIALTVGDQQPHLSQPRLPAGLRLLGGIAVLLLAFEPHNPSNFGQRPERERYVCNILISYRYRVSGKRFQHAARCRYPNDVAA